MQIGFLGILKQKILQKSEMTKNWLWQKIIAMLVSVSLEGISSQINRSIFP